MTSGGVTSGGVTSTEAPGRTCQHSVVPQLLRWHVRARLVARGAEVIVCGGVLLVDAAVARAEVDADSEQR